MTTDTPDNTGYGMTEEKAREIVRLAEIVGTAKAEPEDEERWRYWLIQDEPTKPWRGIAIVNAARGFLSGIDYARKKGEAERERLRAEIKDVQDALGTGEEGDALAHVAREAHSAEQSIASWLKEEESWNEEMTALRARLSETQERMEQIRKVLVCSKSWLEWIGDGPPLSIAKEIDALLSTEEPNRKEGSGQP